MVSPIMYPEKEFYNHGEPGRWRKLLYKGYSNNLISNMDDARVACETGVDGQSLQHISGALVF